MGIGSTKRVLIVEDNDDNPKILVYRLRRIGDIEIDEASNGLEAVHAVATRTPVHHNLASELAARHRYGKARRELKKALAIDARYWPSELGLAGIDCVRGRVLCAGSHLATAARAGAPPEQTSALPAACGQRAAVR